MNTGEKRADAKGGGRRNSQKSIAIIIFKEEVYEHPKVGDGTDRLTIGQRNTTDALQGVTKLSLQEVGNTTTAEQSG